MAKLSRDLAAGILHPRELLFGSGTLGALNSEVIIDADGSGTVSLDLRGTFSLTVEVSGTVDGTNWTLIPMRPVNAASKLYVVSVAGTAAGNWIGSCPGFKKMRARVTAYTSGAAVTTLAASLGLPDFTLDAKITPALATAVGAAGAAVTLTIAAPGAGLRQYLTYLTIDRFVAAGTLTAAAAPVTVTTTNLPGSLAFSIPADAALQGTIYRLSGDFPFPVAASAQNTAVTIVAPLTTGVIWRVTAGYYVAT